MPPTTTPASPRTEHTVLRCSLAVLVAVAACGIDTTTPTYTALFRRYFAPGTPGHCATAGCHLDDSNGWACGTTKETCYQGMVGIGLINLQDPERSTIGDPKNSPLRWINLNGPMPQDNPQPFPEGRDAIIDWVAAGAKDN